MINIKGCVSIPFFKKETFTGSCGIMRFLIRMLKKEDETTVLLAKHWRGPLASMNVKEEQMTAAEFPFDAEGIEAAVAWLNEEYERVYQ